MPTNVIIDADKLKALLAERDELRGALRLMKA